jgi:hypothetical protein
MRTRDIARVTIRAAFTRLIALGTVLLPILLAACAGGGGGGGGVPGY